MTMTLYKKIRKAVGVIVLLAVILHLSVNTITAFAAMNNSNRVIAQNGNDALALADVVIEERAVLSTGRYLKPQIPSLKGFDDLSPLIVLPDDNGLLDTMQPEDQNDREFIYGDERGNKYQTDISDITNSQTNSGKNFWSKMWDLVFNTNEFMMEEFNIINMLSSALFGFSVMIHELLDLVGMSLDNIIFGRVGGNGVRVSDGGTPNTPFDDVYTSLFSFELEKGNPYGVISAMLYSVIRKYMYIFMILIAFWQLIRVGIKNDVPRAKLEFKENMGNLVKMMVLVVAMPMCLEVFLFIRDVMVSAVMKNGILTLFTSSDIGLLDAFRQSCIDSISTLVMPAPNIMASVLYFAANCVCIIFAMMYITNALSMMICVVAFPIVCVKGLFDKKALGSWCMEVVGIAATPILDGVLLIVPLVFNRIANGNIGLNFISLILCTAMLAVRQFFRRLIGLQSNALEASSLMTAMGAMQLGRSVLRAGSQAYGQIKDGIGQGKSDDAKADYYEAQAAKDEFDELDAGKQIDNGVFAQDGSVKANMAAQTVSGGGGNLAYKAKMMQEAKSRAAATENKTDEYSYPWEEVSAPGDLRAREVVEEGHSGLFMEEHEASMRAADLRKAQVSELTGHKTKDDIAEFYAGKTGDFESEEFADKISNAKKAELYRKRARSAREKGIMGAGATIAGGVIGGGLGFAATLFADSGTRAIATGIGIDAGSGLANASADMGGAVASLLKSGKKNDTVFEGEGSELVYTIKQGKDGTSLETQNRFARKNHYRVNDASVEPDGNTMVANVSSGANEMVAVHTSIHSMPGAHGEIDGSTTIGLDVQDSGQAAIGTQELNEDMSQRRSERIREDFEALLRESPLHGQIYNDSVKDAVLSVAADTDMHSDVRAAYREAQQIAGKIKGSEFVDADERARKIDEIRKLASYANERVAQPFRVYATENFRSGMHREAGRDLNGAEMRAVTQDVMDKSVRCSSKYLEMNRFDFDSILNDVV